MTGEKEAPFAGTGDNATIGYYKKQLSISIGAREVKF